MYLCVVQNYWGRGATIEQAKANAKKAGGSLKKYVIFECADPTVCVDDMGSIVHDFDTPVKEVKRYPASLK